MPRCGPNNTTPHFDVGLPESFRSLSLSLALLPTLNYRLRPHPHTRPRPDLQPTPTNCRLVGNQQQHGRPGWCLPSRFVYFLHPRSRPPRVPIPPGTNMRSIPVMLSLSAVDSSDPKFLYPERRITLSDGNTSVSIGRASQVSSKGFVAGVNNAWFDSPVISRYHAELYVSMDSKVRRRPDSLPSPPY